MRIAYDYQIFCQQRHGGISRYVGRLAAQMASAHQVRIFAPLHQSLYLGDLPQGVVWGRGLNGYPAKTSRFFFFVNRHVGAAAMQRWRPSVVHETYYSRLRTGPAGTATVLTVYDMINELFREDFPLHDNISELKRKAVERVDHVICISQSTRSDLIRLFETPPEKVSYVHLGFQRFESPGGHVDTGLAPHRPFLLHVGSRDGYKNFDAFLRSVAASSRLMRDVSIVAFGGGPFTNAQHALIRKLGFGDGQVAQVSGDDALLGRFYDRARAFVYPSLYEGFGLPPLEAMAHHCPVISSNTSSMPEVIGNAAEYFDPRSGEEITRAIERVVYSDARSRELIESGTRRLEHFSWAKCAAETAAIYEELA